MQMPGVIEKDASVMVGATPEVVRKHYEKLDQPSRGETSRGGNAVRAIGSAPTWTT